MAILGTLMINQVTSRFTNSLVGFGVPESTATQIAAGAAGGNAHGGGGAGQVSAAVRAEIMKAYQVDFADAVSYVFYGMAVVMVVALIAGLFHPGGGLWREPASSPGLLILAWSGHRLPSDLALQRWRPANTRAPPAQGPGATTSTG